MHRNDRSFVFRQTDAELFVYMMPGPVSDFVFGIIIEFDLTAQFHRHIYLVSVSFDRKIDMIDQHIIQIITDVLVYMSPCIIDDLNGDRNDLFISFIKHHDMFFFDIVKGPVHLGQIIKFIWHRRKTDTLAESNKISSVVILC